MDQSTVLDYLGNLETKVRKLASEHQKLKTELMASMEENKILSLTIQNLEDEMHNLNHSLAETMHDLKERESQVTFLKQEKETLIESLDSLSNGQKEVNSEAYALLVEENQKLENSLQAVQDHIGDIQLKSEALLAEFDRIQNLNIELSQKNADLEQIIKDQATLDGNAQQLTSREEGENDPFELESSRKEAEMWKRKFEEQEEVLKNFKNQEKNSKIVESIAEDGINPNELKIRINEYIKEIDKCITQLSE